MPLHPFLSDRATDDHPTNDSSDAPATPRDGAASRPGTRAGRGRGVVVGLAGGAVASAVMSTFRMPLSRSPPPTAWLWARLVGGDPEASAVPGLALHLLYGTVAGGVFGALVAPSLGGDEGDRERRGALLGVCYGSVLSAFGASVLVEGLLGLELDEDERFVFDLAHLVYGMTLGTWVGSRL